MLAAEVEAVPDFKGSSRGMMLSTPSGPSLAVMSPSCLPWPPADVPWNIILSIRLLDTTATELKAIMPAATDGLRQTP